MSEFKHTPGPWTHRLSDDEEACNHEIMGAWENGVRRWVGGAETLEDARLIAAAPDLLSALHDMVRYAKGGDIASPNAVERAIAAIAKATGKE